jgi:hypothetical protein
VARDPIQAVRDLREEVSALGLSRGTADRLSAMLDGALADLMGRSGRSDVAARAKLTAFAQEVRTQREKAIPAEGADPPIDFAEQIVGLLETTAQTR